jgi:16S rRNA (cytosine967-C5)-methyltransferase
VISPARVAALDILLRVENHGAYASELLHSDRLNELTPEDRGLCTELVLGVLRWRSRLDEAIASVSSQKLTKLDPEVLEALRLAAYQVGFLERVPSHAAVNESVELVKRKKKRSAAPFVNAVLRKLISKRDVFEPVLASGPKTIPDLVAMYAHPLWLVDRWAARYGLESADEICSHDQRIPVTAIRARDEVTISELAAVGLDLQPGRLLSSARIVQSGDVTKTRAFLDGRIAIQDEASQLVAMLVGRGERLLDCCAAPGGKTAILAERNPKSPVVAVEIHEVRAQLLRQRLEPHSNVEVLTADASALARTDDFDRILTDVPCSGTGTLARNPEIKWRLQPSDLNDLHARQVRILRAALQKLRPGGRLIYSTCSLEPEENEEVIYEVVNSGNYEIVDVISELQQLQRDGQLAQIDVQELTDGPFLRILPGRFGTDGFFAAQITTKPNRIR